MAQHMGLHPSKCLGVASGITPDLVKKLCKLSGGLVLHACIEPFTVGREILFQRIQYLD